MSSFSPGDLLTLKIDAIAFGGEGIGRLDGRVFFVPFTAIGDEAEVRIREVKKNFARADLVRLINPGPHRTEPPCPYYGPCGGCQYQHLEYDEELRIKSNQVAEALQRLGKIAEPPLLPILRSPQEYGTRNRITVHAYDDKLGFHRAQSRELVDVAKCLLAQPEVNEALTQLRQKNPKHGDGNVGHFSLRASGLPPSAFHQVNHFLLEPLRDLVRAWCEGPETHLVEGYCGGGFFTGTLAPGFEKIWAIEQDGRALRDAERLNIAHVRWIEGKVEAHLSRVLGEATANQTATLVLVDPPREGLAAEALAALLTHRPARIVYVSCNPATLARDLEKLSAAYAPARIQPVDLFPRTAQIETVSELVRK